MVGYAPASHNAHPTDAPFHQWLHLLQNVVSTNQASTPVFILADFNARVGQDAPVDAASGLSHSPAHGGYGHGSFNDRGILLHELALKLGLWISNTWFDVPEANRVTHTSNLPTGSSQIDYILCPRKWATRCIRSTARHECILHSDHYPVVADFRWRTPRTSHAPQEPKTNWDYLHRLPKEQRDALRDAFFSGLEPLLSDIMNDTLATPEALDSCWDHLKDSIKQVARDTLPLRSPPRRETKYMTADLHRLLQELQRYKSLTATTVEINGIPIPRTTHVHYLHDHLRRGLRQAQHCYITQQCHLATESIRHHDLKSLYKILRDLTATSKPPPIDHLSLPAHVRHAHFRSLFAAARPPVDDALLAEMTSLADATKANKWRHTISSEPPTLDEIRSAITLLKTGRAPGVEGLEAELFKFGIDAIAPPLQRLCTVMWTHNHIPREWSLSEILPILKPGKPSNLPTSYRPISIVSMISKILMLVLHARLSPMVDDTVGDYQHGFRKGRSTTDAIFTYQRLCEKYRQTQASQLHTCFVDLTQAFDTVSWDLLWHTLQISGTPPRIITLLRTLYLGSTVKIRTHPSEPEQPTFTPTAGVRQGCVLSPTLFILMFDYVVRVALKGMDTFPERTHWPVLGGALLAILGYADDLALIARHLPALESRMHTLQTTCTRAGLILSDKTKIMSHPGSESIPPTTPLQLSGLTVEVVSKFKYLGAEVTATMMTESTIRARLAKASTAFALLSSIWRTSHLPTRIKSLMYKTLVRPIALYGAETWAFPEGLESLLDSADMAWLRQIAGVSRIQKIRNDTVRQRAQCLVSLSEACRQYRLRYYGHTCRLPSHRAPNIALHRDAPGHRRQGRPSTAWLTLVEADAASRGLNIEDLYNLAAERDEYREKVVYADRLDGKPTRMRPRPAP